MNTPSALPDLFHENKYMDDEMFMGGTKRQERA
jgi:hypothetical protein